MEASAVPASSNSLIPTPGGSPRPHPSKIRPPQGKILSDASHISHHNVGASVSGARAALSHISHDFPSSAAPRRKIPSTERTFARPGTPADSRSGVPQGLFGSSLPARLVVSRESGRQVQPFECALVWQDVSEWKKFWERAEIQLEESGEYAREDKSTRLCLQSGSAHIICLATQCEKQSCFLENDRDWAVQLQHMIASFVVDNFETEFLVEIRWTFTILSLPFDSKGSLKNSIRTAIFEHSDKNWAGDDFIPRKVLESIFTPDNVRNVMAHDESLANVDFEDPESRWSSRDTFAGYVYINAVPLLAMFVYCKADLLCLYQLLKNSGKDGRLPVIHRLLEDRDRPKNADRADFDILRKEQSRFRAHTFRLDPKNRVSTHEKLDSSVVVPVLNTQQEQKWLGGGAFGDVFEVKIHSDHHKFDSNRAKVYALKVFRDDRFTGSDDFKAEEAALRRLATKPHAHLVIHLAAWTQNNKFYMLFPCARENLRSYLSRSAPKSSGRFILNLLRQLRDLSSAVEHIHRLAPGGLGNPAGDKLEPKPGQHRATGLHYDLKPENVLLFLGNGEDADVWKISDFGTARIHDIVVSGSRPMQQGYKSHKTKTPTKGDPVYGAPDYVIQGVTSRPYDVWSLGCILLEILLWAFHGEYWKENTFADDRLESPPLSGSQTQAFWFEDGEGVGLKPIVISLIETLQENCSKWGVLPELVNMVPDMLRLKPEERPRAAVIRSDMESLLFQADIDLDDEPKLYDERRGRSGKELAAPPSNSGRTRGGSIDRHTISIPSRRRDDSQGSCADPPNHHYTSSGYREDFAESDSALQGAGQHLKIDTSMSPPSQRSRSPSVTVRSPEGKYTMEHLGAPADGQRLPPRATEFSSEDLQYRDR